MSSAHSIPGMTIFERGWLSSNNVLFEDGVGGETVLVDTGYCTHADQTVALVKHALGSRQLDRVVNTHLHSDHCGGNSALQAEFGCAVSVPAADAWKVDSWDEDALNFQAVGQRCPRFARGGAIMAGDWLALAGREWQVIASPGHDPSSFVLYERTRKILISADALWENGFGVIFPELEGEPGFEAVQHTLDTLSSLSVHWTIPGHGAPFTDFEGALGRARQRLASHMACPSRHAKHACKVLVKFRLMQSKVESLEDLLCWFEALKYAKLSLARYFEGKSARPWGAELIGELCRSGALRSEGNNIVDVQ